jgi:hypothetical protein
MRCWIEQYLSPSMFLQPSYSLSEQSQALNWICPGALVSNCGKLLYAVNTYISLSSFPPEAESVGLPFPPEDLMEAVGDAAVVGEGGGGEEVGA